MSSITNKMALERVSNRRYSNIKSTNILGIIFTGDYPELNEQIVEEEILKNFDITSIEKINTIGKKEKYFQYVNRFAKKNNLPITPFSLETYSFEDVDFYIKRNANICYKSDSMIIFHGDTKNNVVAWHALSTSTRVKADDGKSVFINSTQKPNLVGFEKEIHELLQIPDENVLLDKVRFMQVAFFELMSSERNKFSKYAQQGKEMSIKQVLRKLTEVYLEGRDLDFFDGYAFLCESFIDSVIWYVQRDLFDEDQSPKSEEIEQYIKKEIHPDFFYRSGRREEDVCYVMFYFYWHQFEYLMLHMIPTYERKGDYEGCAALCFGQWMTFLKFKGIDNLNFPLVSTSRIG